MNNNNAKLILGVIGALVLFMAWRRRKRTAGQAGGVTTLTSAYGGGVQPYTPQSPVTLQPGESVYDPNSEGLLDTPTAPYAGQSIPLPPQSQTPSAPAYQVNVNYPAVTKKGSATITPAKRPKYAPASALHTGPQSPGPGWRGIGGGWWAPPVGAKK